MRLWSMVSLTKTWHIDYRESTFSSANNQDLLTVPRPGLRLCRCHSLIGCIGSFSVLLKYWWHSSPPPFVTTVVGPVFVVCCGRVGEDKYQRWENDCNFWWMTTIVILVKLFFSQRINDMHTGLQKKYRWTIVVNIYTW